MSSKQQARNGWLGRFHQRVDLMTGMNEPASPFKPTELDRALERDPVAEAGRRALLVASGEEAPLLDNHPDATAEQSPPEPPVEPANRKGQLQTAAASLAAGMIAAEGRPVTAAEAVEKVQEVMEELKRRE